ncbi:MULTISPECIES: RnfH family protein [unclassified Shewanella]|uniref:RnfH family protein n=1 Tax=unclassified Shewanella TaxID=196818 RepID=UPI000C83576E|nr:MULTISPECIES: RnfH family protein [unclassified Shewanella]MDO6619893.1 RnfH family protein [Shewanella sp. 6_MG-2023]MDO6641070.1 RnfH family protein [Shewanella sp. 5_MG-2023]MDO6679103.1 RnfH family protein [Shewanella sp. 4_MG-2023]MDO6776352.1 RnfH family protein [Shewanella sp. 3_MG-2023]PMG27046.1 RnfH family protein [Shewanella sp. 10N.286.52.C2]
MTNDVETFAVDVIYALPTQQKIISVNVLPGTTFIEAVKQSNIVSFFPEIDLAKVKLGVFSRQVKHDEVLVSGQRIEIYRPLIADPKDVRRKRAEKAKEEGRSNKITGAKVN